MIDCCFLKCVTALVLTGLPCLCPASDDDYKPEIAAASGDAALAISGFRLPEGTSGSLVAAEPSLANPVAFQITADGRIYVCETFRQEQGVEDNRSHMNWLLNDLRLQSVEERLAMFRRYLGDDVEKYGVQHDRVRLLQDTDGDGQVDRDTVFAGGFQGVLDGTGAGVLEHDGRVFYTCIPELWALRDIDGDGIAEQRESLHHGYGVRVAFRGHDMHGLIAGPDGRIYYSIGDRGYNVVTQEGTRLLRPDSGAVFRCEPDGSHLEVFAYGLRNPQELAFDDFGNLFTGDNNSDGGDQARWVHIVPGSDTGWRMYFQYLDDRGPWNRERMWYPYRSDAETRAVQPRFIVPPIANLADGPSGLTHYPGTGLSERYDGHFFMADFRGQSSNSGIRSFANKPKGASYELTDSHEYLWSILPTDVDFGPDSALYVTDWVNGWVGEGKGRLYRFAPEGLSANAEAEEVKLLLSTGIAAGSTEELVDLLGHTDRRVRQQAQFRLAADQSRNELSAAATNETDSSTLRRIHAIWGLWQLGRAEIGEAASTTNTLLELSRDSPAEVVVQALHVMGDLHSRFGLEIAGTDREQVRMALRSGLTHDSARVRLYAALGLQHVGAADDIEAVMAMLDENADEDAVLRHAGVMALTGIGERNPGLLISLIDYPTTFGRTAAVLALRRHKDADVVRFLNDADPDVVLEAARAINDDGIDSATQALAQIELTPRRSDALLRRTMNANFRLGTLDAAARITAVAADESFDDSLRMVAMTMLQSWNDPGPLDTVDGRWRPLPVRDVGGLGDVIRPGLPAMLAGPKAIRSQAISMAAAYGIRDVTPMLQAILSDPENEGSIRAASLRALGQLDFDGLDGLMQSALRDSNEELKLVALELLSVRAPEAAMPVLTATVNSGAVGSQQKAIAILTSMESAAADAALLDAFDRLLSGTLSPALQLDLLKAAEERGSEAMQQRVARFEQARDAGDPLSAWIECLDGGDADRGSTVFFGRSAASCRRCHKVAGSGSDVGPELTKVAIEDGKDRRYLLESIVLPNAKIARGFETVIVVTIEGRIYSGIVKGETDDILRLMTPQGAIISVAKEDIDDRAKGQSGMPADLAKNLSKDEIRDLVAYLATLDGSATNSTEHGAAPEVEE